MNFFPCFVKVDKKDVAAFIMRDLSEYDEAAGGYQTTVERSVEEVGDDDDDYGNDFWNDDLVHVSPAAAGHVLGPNLKHLYVHYGIENALLGKSAGLVHQRLYVENLRLIDNLDEGLLTDEFQQLLYGDLMGARAVSLVL